MGMSDMVVPKHVEGHLVPIFRRKMCFCIQISENRSKRLLIDHSDCSHMGMRAIVVISLESSACHSENLQMSAVDGQVPGVENMVSVKMTAYINSTVRRSKTLIISS
jgi:hypothetical protein